MEIIPTSCYIHWWSREHFTWYLPNKRLHWKDYIESGVIKPENTKLAFFMRFYPHGKEQNNEDYASLEFGCLESSLLKNLNLKLTFVVEDKRRQKLFKTIADHNFDQNDLFVCNQFIQFSELDKDKENLLPKDTLTICCSIQEHEHLNLIQGFAQGDSVRILSQMWTIHNFTDYLAGGKMSWKKELKSKLIATMHGDIEFHLSLDANGCGVIYKGYFSIFLHFKSRKEETRHTKFSWTIYLLDAYGNRRNMKTIKNRKGAPDVSYLLKFISHVDLLIPWKIPFYLPQNKLTICVDIGDVGNVLIQNFSQCCTITEINALSHIWTIENFTDYLAGGKLHWKNRLYSEVLSTKDGNYEFYLGLSPCGHSDDTRNHISIYLHQKKGENFEFNFVLSIIDADGKRTNILNFTNNLKMSLGYSKYISHVDLLNPQNNYLPQNKLTIAFNIEDVDHKVIRDYHEIRSTTKANYHENTLTGWKEWLFS